MNPNDDVSSVPASENTADLVARLQRHPQLYEQVSALLDEVENRAGALNTADQAEDAIVERMRQFSRRALTQWAEQRQAAIQPAGATDLRRGGKKNSAG